MKDAFLTTVSREHPGDPRPLAPALGTPLKALFQDLARLPTLERGPQALPAPVGCQPGH